MPNKQEIARQNLARFEAWIGERDTRDDWDAFLRSGQIIRTAIVEACGFGRSALIQNPAVADLLRRTEERLAQRGRAKDDRLERLEAFLESRLQGSGEGLPTKHGRLDLDAVAQEIGMAGMATHLAGDAACRSVLNAAADALGLPPINTRDALNADDAVVRKQISRARAEASEHAKVLAEREATIIQLRRRIAQLEEQLAIRDDTGMVMRTEPIR